ncbi:UDP-N-acetylglucosamine transporter yea4 [Penicillium hetheringtonii]|uniref:UDP-N-acetylglucosamine transporter yea4 n=1 Tax=Penicillium hetheringtonii TaxID=911720 RepID=A0AAD6GNB3_9EURO|nr:UDP-N-acetylglucosamine transporter yea4 [Penicillium hetheringtonii]
MINDDASRKSDTYTVRQLKRSSTNTTTSTTSPASESSNTLATPSKTSQHAEILAAAAHATLPNWANVFLMISLIFGGCCSNVFALEAIIKYFTLTTPHYTAL